MVHKFQQLQDVAASRDANGEAGTEEGSHVEL
jgi:hypothetical protein